MSEAIGKCENLKSFALAVASFISLLLNIKLLGGLHIEHYVVLQYAHIFGAGHTDVWSYLVCCCGCCC